jgi:hypothetical protein
MRRRSHVLSAALAVALTAAGCASAPEPTSPSVSGQILTRTEVSYIGATRETNPFIPLSRVIHGAPDEFAVVRIHLGLPAPTLVTIDGSVRDGTGAEVARLQSYQDMADYWNDPTDQLPFRTIQARSDTLQRWYVPSLSFQGNKGRTEYVVVFKGNNPIPRPATVTLSVGFGDEAPQELTFPLPPREKGLFGS